MDELTVLLREAADGDRSAMAAFVRTTQADVWRLCAHLVDPQAADDVTQEVYLRAIRSARQFRGDASARTWLLRIARNTAADEIRRRQRRRLLPPVVEGIESGPADNVALTSLIDDLSVDRRTAFVLTQVLECSYAEAAAICQVPVGTIRSRVARARQDLLEMLAPAKVGSG